MKNHVLRPLFLVIAVIALILVVRSMVVPDDFGVNGKNFTYGFYRAGAVNDWKNFPVKYRGKQACAECHDEEYSNNIDSKHKMIQCENCHGPILNHPEEPEALTIDRSRELCIRCHAQLSYSLSKRSEIPGIDPNNHNPATECSECHNPHKPNLEDM